MRAYQLHMEIVGINPEFILIKINDLYQNDCLIHYYIKDHIIRYLSSNTLAYFIKSNQYQLKKILCTWEKGGVKLNDTLNFVIINNFRFIKNEDFNSIIVIDRRNQHCKISVEKELNNSIHKIYTDGSYYMEMNRSGFAVIIEYPDSKIESYTEKTDVSNSNVTELLAVIKGLSLLAGIKKIRICTDSRYVIKGMAQWIHYWKKNNWYTANGKKVKNMSHWLQIDHLTENKYIEYKWIKGHSNHFENSYCDLLAKEAANE